MQKAKAPLHDIQENDFETETQNTDKLSCVYVCAKLRCKANHKTLTTRHPNTVKLKCNDIETQETAMLQNRH
jgi:hypothetical protein